MQNHETHFDEPGDAKLEALLNEALSPNGADIALPPGLTDRIVQRTTPMLGSSRVMRHVIAFIGPRSFRWAAAIVFLVGWSGLWSTAGLIGSDVRSLVTLEREVAALGEDAELERVLSRIQTLQGEDWSEIQASVNDTFDTWENQLAGEPGATF